MNTLLPRTYDELAEGLLSGAHIGAQLYVSRCGEPIENLAVGEARPGVEMTGDSLMLWLSAGKPLTAAAVMQQVEQGRCRLDDPVCAHLSAFGTHGKEAITIRHLLTHTGGFRWVDVAWPDAAWDEIIDRICRSKLEPDWMPGRTAGYHPYTSWYILGELVQRLSGRPFRDYIRGEICEPLGMLDTHIGMSREQVKAYGNRIGRMQNTERSGQPPHPWSSDEGLLHGAPGGGAYGPIRELGFFYEMLLGEGQLRGARVLQADTVAQMIHRERHDLIDLTFKTTIDWGLGLILDSKHYGRRDVPYDYGPYASPQTFGHSGSQSSVAFADPRHALVVALVFNGMPGELKHQKRVRAVLEALYVDLGLADEPDEPA